MKTILSIIFVFLVNFAISQENLVPNPGFEDYFSCKIIRNETSLDSILFHWKSRHRHPHYFNSKCDAANENNTDYLDSPHLPYEGTAFAALAANYGSSTIPETGITFQRRAYMQVKLLKQLKPDKDYYLSYYLAKTYSDYLNNSHYGVYFSDSLVIEPYETVLNQQLRLELDAYMEIDTVIDLKVGEWQKVSYCFTVDKEYSVMTIGLFAPMDSIKIKKNINADVKQLYEMTSYDNFYLIEIDREVNLKPYKDTICLGDCITLSTNHSLIEGDFDWYLPSSNIESSTDSVVTVCYDQPGTYDVGINIEHCTGEYENYFSRAITVMPEIIEQPFPDEVLICKGEEMELTIPDNYDITWPDGSTTSTYSFSKKGEYNYTVSNAYCFEEFSISLDYYNDPKLQQVHIYSCPGESTIFLEEEYHFPGLYNDTMKSSFGCDSIYFDIDFRYYEEVPIKIEGELGFCEGLSTNLEITSPNNSIVWENGSNTNPRIIDQEGDYIVKVKDNNLCLQMDTISIREYPSPKIISENILDKWYYSGIELPVNYEGNISEYIWINSNGLDCDNCPYPSLTSFHEGLYPIKVINKFGCSDTDSITISFRRANIYIPNIILNNSQNPINGSFFLQSDIELQYNLKIFDRWGNLIYQDDKIPSGQYQLGWQPNSKFNAGVYVYLIEFFENEKTVRIAGDITIL